MNVLQYLQQQVSQSVAALTPRHADYREMVRPANDPKFGDYQINCAMPLQKELGGKPRDIAQKVVDGLPDRDVFSSVEIAGPGFINLRLSDSFLVDQLRKRRTDPRLGLVHPVEVRRLVIDFSSPNVAKPMHIGHLRSTIIGDALCRIHRALGWTVHSDNHLGDWGTQFGMLIYGWRNLRDEAAAQSDPLGELARLYRLVNQLSETDESIAKAARQETAKLHAGDPDNLALWKQFMPWCVADLDRIYNRLDVRFDHTLGESFYQPMLADTVADLMARGIAEESQGAIVVFFPDPDGKVDKDGNPIPLLPPAIIRKADGAFTYATSDLACLKYRVETFHPDVIAYVVDDRQSDHFRQIFAIARKWGLANVELRHVEFGKITGPDGKPYKTRAGGTVGLSDVLDESVARARRIVEENSAELPSEERRRIAEVVGPGAVKYGDLSQNRSSDYVFDWDKMISLTGNTATYMQYAYTRTRGILRKAGMEADALRELDLPVLIGTPTERSLALGLVRYPEAVAQAAADFKPNILTAYLYDLANRFSAFFRDCPVVQAETEELRRSRLGLCLLTGDTIHAGLHLLGIQTIDRM